MAVDAVLDILKLEARRAIGVAAPSIEPSPEAAQQVIRIDEAFPGDRLLAPAAQWDALAVLVVVVVFDALVAGVDGRIRVAIFLEALLVLDVCAAASLVTVAVAAVDTGRPSPNLTVAALSLAQF